jgi:hypothetical protein
MPLSRHIDWDTQCEHGLANGADVFLIYEQVMR